MAELARPETPLTASSGRKVTIRDWYVSNFCGEEAINQMLQVQNVLPRYQPQITRYCEFLSLFGEPPFYTFFIPIVFWVGLAKEAALFCTMMSVTLYFVDNMKDLFSCPRPPCPPLRRAGKDSHGMEYGMPSTHTGLGMMCTYHVCLSLSTMFPHVTWIIWLGGASFVIQTALSRMYLGLHWPGDLLFGAFVFAFAWMLQEIFIRDFINAVYDSNITPWYLFVLSHIGNSICVSPRDPCPCYTDTVRFFGAAAGATFGGYIGVHHIDIVSIRAGLPHDAQGHMLFTLRFWLETVFGFVVIAVWKECTSFVTPRVLKPLYTFLSGAQRDRLPVCLHAAYRGLCCVVGVLLLRRVYTNGVPFPENEASLFAPGHCAATFHNSENLGEKEGKAHATMISPGTAPSAAGRGQVWSYKTNNYWWIWDVHTKSMSYVMVGVAATAVSPNLWKLLFSYSGSEGGI